MNKVVIVGCGIVGLSYAFSLINSSLPVEELVLIDINESKLAGSVLDLSHCAISLHKNIKVKVGTYFDCSNANIVCITAGKSQSDMVSRVDAVLENTHIMESIMEHIVESGFKGIYLVASNPLDVMSYVVWKHSGISPHKVIGSGTLLETNRLKYFISQKLSISYDAIEGYVLGEHGDSQFVVWSSVKINGNSASDYLSKEEMDEISSLVKNTGYDIVQKTGATHYGISGCLRELTDIILNDRTTILPVSCYEPNFNIYISSLAKVNSTGIVENIPSSLTEIEQRQYESSAHFISDIIQKSVK